MEKEHIIALLKELVNEVNIQPFYGDISEMTDDAFTTIMERHPELTEEQP